MCEGIEMSNDLMGIEKHSKTPTNTDPHIDLLANRISENGLCHAW